MKNKFTVSADGLIATIQLKRRSGEIIHCHVDSADLPKLLAFNVSWYAAWNPKAKRFYVDCSRKVNGTWRTLSLHRFLMDEPEGLEIDHWNQESLDNRRENLRIATKSQNMMNRSGARSDSKTGHRAISHAYGKFMLKVTINGKKTYIGLFKTIEDAIAVRKQFPGYN